MSDGRVVIFSVFCPLWKLQISPSATERRSEMVDDENDKHGRETENSGLRRQVLLCPPAGGGAAWDGTLVLWRDDQVFVVTSHP